MSTTGTKAGALPETERMERLIYLLAIGGTRVDGSEIPPHARAKWESLGAAFPLTTDFIGNQEPGSEFDYAFFTDATPRDINAKMDVSFVNDRIEDAVSMNELGICRTQSISAKSARGGKVLPFMVRHTEAILNFVTGEYTSDVSKWGCALNKGSAKLGGWRWCESPGYEVRPGTIEAAERKYQQRLGMSVSLQWTQNLWWHADISLGQAPGIRLPITDESLVELWETRDRATGGERIRRLVHWVQSHRRRRKSSGELDVVVRKHLRGGLSFCWNQMDVTVRPAYDDLTKLHAQGLAKHIPDHVVEAHPPTPPAESRG